MNIKKYLPSKKFSYIALGIICLAVLIFFVSGFFGKKSFQSKENREKLATQKLTVNQLIQKDVDQDGVADWEEALWGTDSNKKATFDGTPDGTYIDNKKKLLNLENDANTENLTETDKFAREFFTAFTAMKASGQVDANTINNFSNALGQKIVNPTLLDAYSEKDLKISKKDDLAAKKAYYQSLKTLFEKYKALGVGNELSVISSDLAAASSPDNGTKMNNDLLVISDTYKEFAEKVIATPVPKSVSQIGLRIANGANNTGISVFNMSKISSDPVIGISGLSQYQKYSDDLINAVKELEGLL